MTVEQFKGGQSNPTYRLTDGAGRHYVLRRKPPGKLLPSAHAVDREFRVISALNRTDVPTPRAYALCEDESVVGTPFYIMEYCDGRVLWDPLLPDVPKEDRAGHPSRHVRGAGPPPLCRLCGLGLSDFGRPGSYVARQISRWGKQYKASETEKIESMDRLLDWLPANLPTNDETVLVHGDYRLDNMIFHATEPRVLGIIDWEISTLGDPLAELSYLCMLWRTPKDWGGLVGHDLGALGLPTEQEMVAYYSEPVETRRARPRALGILHGLQSVPRVLHPPGRLCPLARRHGVEHARGRFRQAGEARGRSRLGNRGEACPEPRDEQAQDRSSSRAAGCPSQNVMRGRRSRRSAPPPSPQFAERGYPVVTVRDIMKACGLTQGALYNHFKSKDELLHDIIASTQGELERLCQQAVAGAGGDPRAKLGGLRAGLCHAPLPAADRGTGRQSRDRLARRGARGRHSPQPSRHPRRRRGHPARTEWKRGVFDPPRIDGKHDLKAIAMALLDQCTHVSMWYGPGGELTEEQMAKLYADMALRVVGSRAAGLI